MEMDLQIKVRGESTLPIIDLTGEVDAYTSSRFRETMLELVERGAINLVINMEDVEYIDSSGLGALVGGLKRVSEKDGKILIVCSNPQIKKVFEITGLEKVFSVYTEEDEAVSIIS